MSKKFYSCVLIAVIMFGFTIYTARLFAQVDYQETVSYSYSQDAQNEDNSGWGALKKDSPYLYYPLKFLNPPMLNNVGGNILTILFAVGTLSAFFAFEGFSKIIIIFLNLYCWGRIVSWLLMMGLVGTGRLSP